MIDREALLRQAEVTLSTATTPAEVQSAHRMLKAAIRTTRRQKAASGEGLLAKSVTEALRIFDAQRDQGVSLADREAGLERTLRACWPKGREWKHLCQACEDLGWVFKRCTPETPCGRPFKLPGQRLDDYTGRGHCLPDHPYAVPCLCSKGQDFSRGLQAKDRSRGPDLTTVGKTTKMSRLGR